MVVLTALVLIRKILPAQLEIVKSRENGESGLHGHLVVEIVECQDLENVMIHLHPIEVLIVLVPENKFSIADMETVQVKTFSTFCSGIT